MQKHHDGTGIIEHDPWLEPHRNVLINRHNQYLETKRKIDKHFGSLDKMARAYEYFGFTRGKNEGKSGVWYREWAPGALGLFLIGDFNGWERTKHPLVRDEFGVWSIFIEDDDDHNLKTGGRVKVHVATKDGQRDRIPAYIREVSWDEEGKNYVGVVNLSEGYEWKNDKVKRPKSLRIYEAHVGIAQEEEKIGSFEEFEKKVLPRIKKLGYTAVQLMAVQHHPYYASFGYQVGSFFAVASHFGSMSDLKRLIDTAHGMGLMVFLDLIHSHAVKNFDDGLNEFDGTDHQYFHAGSRGDHAAWDTKLFDYGKTEVQRFLLSNARYWLDEFRFDGFRLDGVTSMIYWDHGLGKAFTNYDQYFDGNVDEDALIYLKLLNQLVHDLDKNTVTIAEEVSGLPGLALPTDEGGIGFDYRLAMGIPDNWIKLVKEKKDEDWRMNEIFTFLRNRRNREKHVAYVESHDQALVGDKTIAFWLMDKEMYWHMDEKSENLVIDRGLALHKMIRLITYGLGGEAYLNFMGNEFGHPEWIDFPRAGNNDSFKYARRQWSLVDNEQLKYRYLNDFDRAMHAMDNDTQFMGDDLIELLRHHEDDKTLVFRRGELVFVFNFHPDKSYEGLRLGVPDRATYEVILSTDEVVFGGFGRVKRGILYPGQDVGCDNRSTSIEIYLPARSAQVLKPVF